MPENKKPWANQHVHTCKERPNDFCNACYQKEYRIANRTATIQGNRKNYSENRDKISAERRRRYREDEIYRNKIKEKATANYRKNKDKILARDVKTRYRGNPGGSRRVYWEMAISLLIQRDGPNCALCGELVAIEVASIDHIKEIRKGTDHSATNLQLAHRSCNMSRPRVDYKPNHYDSTIE